MIKKLPKIVSLRITCRCNNNCKHCFAHKNVEEMSLSKMKRLIYFFYKKGVEGVLLTGGEPLIRDDFGEIVKEIKKYNLKVFLDTSGDFFFKYKDLISEYVDMIGLSIDFTDSSYRNEDNLQTVLKILGYYAKLNKRPKIRVGTVATKDNLETLTKVGEMIKDYPVDIWKIYQFVPKNPNALKNRAFLELSDEEFIYATQDLEDIFSSNFKVIISKRKDRDRAYFFINSDGTVFMPIDDSNVCEDKVIGDIFDEDIIEKWEECVFEGHYVDNAKITFVHKF